MEHTFYQATHYADLAFVAIALGFAIAWQGRTGKAFLVASLALGLTGSLIFEASHILSERMDLPWASLHIIGRLAAFFSGALLLGFVIVGGAASGRVAAADRPGGIFSMRGRYNRARYFWTMFLLGLIFNTPRILVGLAGRSLGNGYAIAQLIVLAIAFAGAVLSAFQVVKRLHDLGRPGWHYWLLLIPFYDIYLALVLLFAKGTTGTNPYGVDPLARGEEMVRLEPIS
jgi:uncharacterized membrane protein YhaH (DUF805 family)